MMHVDIGKTNGGNWMHHKHDIKMTEVKNSSSTVH